MPFGGVPAKIIPRILNSVDTAFSQANNQSFGAGTETTIRTPGAGKSITVFRIGVFQSLSAVTTFKDGVAGATFYQCAAATNGWITIDLGPDGYTLGIGNALTVTFSTANTNGVVSVVGREG